MMDYITSVRRTFNKTNKREAILEACLGISGETGEIVDMVKKNIFQGHPLNEDKLREEVGDALSYLQFLSDIYGFSLFDAMHDNTIKRMKRFPKGFSTYDSIQRIDTNTCD